MSFHFELSACVFVKLALEVVCFVTAVSDVLTCVLAQSTVSPFLQVYNVIHWSRQEEETATGAHVLPFIAPRTSASS